MHYQWLNIPGAVVSLAQKTQLTRTSYLQISPPPQQSSLQPPGEENVKVEFLSQEFKNELRHGCLCGKMAEKGYWNSDRARLGDWYRGWEH